MNKSLGMAGIVALWLVGVALIVFIGLIALGKVHISPQLVLSTPNGDIDINCNSFATCSPLLKNMGYNDAEVTRILTSCDNDVCVVMP